MKISKIRQEIDVLDSELLEIIAERLKLADELAKMKFENGMKVEDKKREREILKSRTKILNELGYDDEDFVDDLFKLILNKSKEVQKMKIRDLEIER